MPSVTIDPAKSHFTKEEENILRACLSSDKQVYEKNIKYVISGIEVIFSNHLVRKENTNELYVVSSDKEPFASGGNSVFRDTVSKLFVDSNNQLLADHHTDMLLRISNATRTSAFDPDYDHDETNKRYEAAEKKFTHLDIGKPSPVTKRKKTSEAEFLFDKDYTLVKKISGKNLYEGVKEYLEKMRPTTAEFVSHFLIPLLKAYQSQINAVQMVHRDIKPENVLMDYHFSGPNENPTFNFIDVDRSVKSNTKEGKSVYGSIGYIDPELLDKRDNYTATVSRDIFSLGVLAICCVNPDLEMTRLLTEQAKGNTKEMFKILYDMMESKKSLEPEEIATVRAKLDKEDNSLNIQDKIFSKIAKDPNHQNEASARNDILSIIKKMTGFEMANRYQAIDDVLNDFQKVQVKLTPAKDTTLNLYKQFAANPPGPSSQPTATKQTEPVSQIQSSTESKNIESKKVEVTKISEKSNIESDTPTNSSRHRMGRND